MNSARVVRFSSTQTETTRARHARNVCFSVAGNVRKDADNVILLPVETVPESVRHVATKKDDGLVNRWKMGYSLQHS